MKPFNLKEHLANPSKKIVTREGKEARIVCTNRKANDKSIIVALVKDSKGNEWATYYNKEGKLFSDEDYNIDLFFVSEKKEGYVNIYKNIYKNNSISQIYDSYEEAFNSRAIDNYVTTIKIEWEE